MNPLIHSLHPYPFQKLADLLSSVEPNSELPVIKLTIGEPQHDAPSIVLETLKNALDGVSKYPLTKGENNLRETISGWACNRFNLPQLSADSQILPVTGTREALFAITQALVGEKKDPLVVSPNPFYQIYEGAGILAGAELHYLPCAADNQYKIDYQAVPDSIWQRCELLFVCSPNNPAGSVTTLDEYRFLLEKAKQYNFAIIADECYSEIYFEEKPLGLLDACIQLGNHNYSNCLIFQSLSKRSNLPGLRSGFVAGDASLLKPFLQYRTYHGCAMPLHHQLASITAWNDEAHVANNRDIYQRKFKQVLDILSPVMSVSKPEAGFYLWPKLPMNDEEFCTKLYHEESVLVLPGSYLGRDVDGHNPGQNHVRMALVAEESECVEAAQRIARFIKKHQNL
ncbi:succinyldiaminopimelate transaminase [Marinomonas gallaica]|uniref:succinyldiaminopimelate transaminase n=1 Tax=Marinomonas gallaica TaxID=1806667 RepID=UPI003A8D1F83